MVTNRHLGRPTTNWRAKERSEDQGSERAEPRFGSTKPSAWVRWSTRGPPSGGH
jgi:hypothetical protein